jgi:peptide/nickel transport system substrate-binding protein
MLRKFWLYGFIAVFVLSFVGLAAERTGAWVDEIVIQEQPDNAKAITMLEKGEGDLYMYSIAEPDLYKRIIASDQLYVKRAYGVYTELTFNPVLKFDDGRLNPFGDPKIREAMNWLVDRDYIANELYGGLAIPRYLPIVPTFPDYARLVDVARALETKYAHTPANVEKAKKIIADEMKALGAELVDGKWTYNGNPVEITFLIRVEDVRKQIGDYVANILEDLGFTVNRKYGRSRDLAPLWILGNPAEGKWNVYTGGWLSTVVSRDEADNFDFFYTKRGLPYPLWQAYQPAEEFDEISKKLANRDFSTMEERNQLMAKALELALKDSVRVWIANESPVFAIRKGIDVASDLSGGVYGCALWPYTIRKEGEVGGTVKVLNGEMLNEPWNPPAGSNWIYDTTVYRATRDVAVLPDPYTGLYLPQRVEKAEVYVVKGLPVTKTMDWVDLQFVDEIKVPADAYIDWDAKAQKWITVGEKYPDGLTAKTKTVVHFDPNLFNMKWHDGATMDVADVLLPMILSFDQAKPESAIYDESQVDSFQAFQEYFKGFRIVSTDPLVIEWYSDQVYLDAEYIATDAATSFDADYGFGAAPWDAVALGILAEANKELAFTADKADSLKVDQTNYIAGPSLDILSKYLDQALNEGYIPYASVLGQYVTADEAKARYQALKSWYEAHKHFWVGNGPFYMDSIDVTAKIVVLKRFADFPDPATKWAGFAEPKIAEVKMAAPAVLKLGAGAVIPVNITYKGEPYPADEINFVKYLIFDANGDLVLKGQAEYVGGPTWNVVLTPEQTAKLVAGSTKIEVVVSSKAVAIPSYQSTTFVVVP